ncbi:hypothetical protein ABZX74_40020 [Streptomyces olivaceoviridis]|uniref:hypothetical protein n=1 Tax=Streptomyces olivaceoviridis TaxID=1921 RepID=UPI0033BD2F03
MSGRDDRSVHRLSPSVGGTAHRADQIQTARIVGDRAFAETPTGIEVRTDVDGVTADLVSYARLERRDGRRGIVALDCVYERDTLPPAAPGRAAPGRHIALAPEDLAPHRPPYALLARHPARRGYAVTANLLGDDQPERTAAFYVTTLRWLRGRPGRRPWRRVSACSATAPAARDLDCRRGERAARPGWGGGRGARGSGNGALLGVSGARLRCGHEQPGPDLGGRRP